VLIAFNKPFGVACKFSPEPRHKTLADYIDVRSVYPAGRLDTDSEGLLLLTDDGKLNQRLTDPRWKATKTYLVQVEGVATDDTLAKLHAGVELNDGPTLPADARAIDPPAWLWPRTPPIRVRKTIPDCWIELAIREGRNRQVRRMTAAVGLPTLRLVRVAIGPYALDGLAPGQWRELRASP